MHKQNTWNTLCQVLNKHHIIFLCKDYDIPILKKAKNIYLSTMNILCEVKGNELKVMDMFNDIPFDLFEINEDVYVISERKITNLTKNKSLITDTLGSWIYMNQKLYCINKYRFKSFSVDLELHEDYKKNIIEFIIEKDKLYYATVYNDALIEVFDSEDHKSIGSIVLILPTIKVFTVALLLDICMLQYFNDKNESFLTVFFKGDEILSLTHMHPIYKTRNVYDNWVLLYHQTTVSVINRKNLRNYIECKPCEYYSIDYNSNVEPILILDDLYFVYINNYCLSIMQLYSNFVVIQKQLPRYTYSFIYFYEKEYEFIIGTESGGVLKLGLFIDLPEIQQ